MSLAFALALGASRRVALLVSAAHGCAALGVLSASIRFAVAGAPVVSALLLSLALPVALCWRRSLAACGSGGWLAVDATGAARWSLAGDASGEGEAVEPLRWHVFAGMAWIEMGASGGRRLGFLSGVDRASDEQWRALMRWLRWLDRGS